MIQTCTLTLKTDKDGKNVTNDAVWYSSDKSVATVKAGVVSAVSENSEGTVTIRARIGRFYQEREVTFTPCTKQIITTFNSENIPESGKSIKWDSTEEKDAAAKNKILATKVIGLSQVEIVHAADAEAMAGIEIHDILKTSTSEDNNKSKGAEGKNTGYQWKDSFSTTNVVAGTKYVSFTFKVKPVSSNAKLSGIYGCVNSGKSGESKAVLVGDVYIGDKKVNDTSYPVYKNISSPSTQSFAPVTITEETEITLTFATSGGDKNGISLQVRDVGLIFE